VLSVRGTVDGFSAPNLEKELQKLVDAGKNQFVVNLSATEFMSSAGWATLVVTLHRIRPKGGRLVLAQMSGAVTQVYEALDFRNVLTTYPSEQEALAALKPLDPKTP